MILLYKIIIILCLGFIFYQDNKSREVYWFLFPLLGTLLCLLFFENSYLNFLVLSMLFNSLLISCVIIILYLYTKLFAKIKFLNHSFGTGDLLFFYAFSFGFPTITFIVLFTFSILFSTLIFFLFKKNKRTVPLAGYMSLFLLFTFIASLFITYPILYIH